MRQEGAEMQKIIKNQRGQGLIEYLIIVALMAVATIGIVRVLSQTVSSRFASITWALQGTKRKATLESVDSSLYKKKDLGSFINGVAEGKETSEPDGN